MINKEDNKEYTPPVHITLVDDLDVIMEIHRKICPYRSSDLQDVYNCAYKPCDYTEIS